MSHHLPSNRDDGSEEIKNSISPIDNHETFLTSNDHETFLTEPIISTDDFSVAQWYWEHRWDTHIIYQGLYFGRRSDYLDELLED